MTKRTILIVDDERLVLTSLQRGLEQEGYEALTAESGEAAIDVCARSEPALALLDVRMPGMSGLELARWLREESEIPFVFLSAYVDRDLIREAAEQGALGYLVKPVDIPQVVAMLESGFARGEEIRKLRRSEETLSAALAGKRAVSTAVGILMERHRIGHDTAFELLRGRARTERRKIEDVAVELIGAAETLNARGTAAGT